MNSWLAQYVFLVDKFIGSVIGKDAIQQGKYIAMVTAKYSQMHSKQQVIYYVTLRVHFCFFLLLSQLCHKSHSYMYYNYVYFTHDLVIHYSAKLMVPDNIRNIVNHADTHYMG